MPIYISWYGNVAVYYIRLPHLKRQNPWQSLLLVTTNKCYTAVFSMFLQLPILHKSWSYHFSSTSTFIHVKCNVLTVRIMDTMANQGTFCGGWLF